MANILKWVQGNDVVVTVWLYEPQVDAQGHPVYDHNVLQWQAVELDSYDEWKVRVKNGCSAITMPASAGEDTGSIIMTVPATLACGDYSIEFTGIKDDVAVRSFETAAFGIVKSNGESNVVFDIVDGEKSCDINIKLQIQPQTVTRGENAYEIWKQIPGNEDKTLQDYLDYLNQQNEALVLLDATKDGDIRTYDFTWDDLTTPIFSGKFVRIREFEEDVDGDIYTYYDLIGRIGTAVMIFGDLTSQSYVTFSLMEGEDNAVEEAACQSYVLQEQLVSGVNIKTINNTSILGEGNISVGGDANVIESISINGTTQTITSKNVDLPVPTSTAVYQIVSISQSAYDALVSGGTVSSTTLYLITS